jgi:hypothetical protein
MRIGFDFDNTIVNYDFVFTEIAKELQLDCLHSPKNSIKNYYEIQLGQPNSWKKVQFKVYCELISKIPASDNFIILLYWLIDNKHDIFIISHKTKYIKINNKNLNLREPAKKWIDKNIPIFNKERIFFESSAVAKVRKIKSLNLDFYVDDLLTILNHRQFPIITKKILFNSPLLELNDIYVASTWDEVKSFIIDEKQN